MHSALLISRHIFVFGVLVGILVIQLTTTNMFCFLNNNTTNMLLLFFCLGAFDFDLSRGVAREIIRLMQVLKARPPRFIFPR